MKNKKSIFAWLVTFAMVLALAIGGAVGAVAYADPEEPELDPQLNVTLDEATGVLTWDAYAYGGMGDLWGYVVYFGTNSERIDGNGNISYNIFNQNPGTSFDLKAEARNCHYASGTYYWGVAACEIDDERVEFVEYLTEVKTGTYNYVSTQTPFAAPTNLRVEGATIAWDAVEGATTYSYRIYKDGEATNVAGTINATSRQVLAGIFETGHQYYFTVYAYARMNNDLDYTYGEIATSATFSFAQTFAINNLKIDVAHPDFDVSHQILTFDDEDGELGLVMVEFYQNGQFVTSTYHVLPFDISYYFGNTLTNWANNHDNDYFDVKITAYDPDYVPVANYSITGWQLGRPYYQPDEPEQPANNGLGAGAIIAIVLAVLVVGGCGAFAVVWFAVKKKTWADLTALCKKKPAAPKAEKTEEAKAAEPAEEKAAEPAEEKTDKE